MSFSIDDLVSSLSSTHVGQEATDLAVLQAQLAETLASSTSTFSRQPPSRGRAQHTQPCNTPLARTPSSSVSWMMDASSDRPRSNSVSYNDMDEDERMVEELLIPSSNSNPNVNPNANYAANTSSYHGYNYNYNYNQAPLSSPISPHSPFSPASQSSFSSHSSASSMADTNTSLFTSTDPFYLSQLQSLNDPPPSSQSVFAQNGRLAQNSPFAMAAHAQYQYQHQHQQIPLSSYTTAF